MVNKTILQNNLNDQVSYNDFFHAFGYADNDVLYMRDFSEKSKTDYGHNFRFKVIDFESHIPEMRTINQHDRGIYFVVNGGGNSDPEVIAHGTASAQFIDVDHGTFEEQIDLLNGFDLEPSIILKTSRGIHVYWLLKDGNIKYFRGLQARLAQYFHSDTTVQNESRVMRVYGFEHRKQDPVLIKLIKFDPDIRYEQLDLDKLLPVLEVKAAGSSGKKSRPEGELVPYGKRHSAVVSKCAEYANRMHDYASPEEILAAVEAWFLQNCVLVPEVDMADFRKKYLRTIEKFLARIDTEGNDLDSAYWAKAVKAWEYYHNEPFDSKKDNAWNDARVALFRADEEGITLPEKGEKPAAIPRAKESDADEIPAIISKEEALRVSKEGKKALLDELALTEKLTIKSTFSNYALISEHDWYLHNRLRFNSLEGRPVIRRAYWDIEEHPIRDDDLFHIRELISRNYGIGNKSDIADAVTMAAGHHSFNPVVDKLRSLAWDGASRISELFPRYLGADRSEYTSIATKILLHGLIQRVFNPGVKFDLCVILADTKQGTGKSTMCRLLALKDEWFTDSLGDLGDNDKAFESIRGRWVCELGEMLATRRTKDIESIKAFLSRTADSYRQRYNIYTELHPRQCVCIGTTNKPQFLPDDPTGNRRFIPLLCDGDKAIVHPLQDEKETRAYIEQCFAEAIQEGETNGWLLTIPEAITEELNELREQTAPDDPRVGQIQSWLDNSAPDVVCSKMIWDKLFGDSFGNTQPKQHELRDISDIMNLKITGWKRYRGKFGSAGAGDIKYRFKDDYQKYGSQRAWIRVKNVPDHVPDTHFEAVGSGTNEDFWDESIPF